MQIRSKNVITTGQIHGASRPNSGKYANFESAAQFSEGLAAVRDKKGGGGFIDHTGKIVIPIPGGYAEDFHNGAAAVGEHLDYP